MKHLHSFLLVAALLLAPALRSQNMILRLQGGTDQTIPLNTLQKITFSASNLVLNFVSGSTQSFGFTSLEKLYFSPITSIAHTIDPQMDLLYNPSDNQIHFRNLPEGKYRVSVCRMDGVVVVNKQISNNESVDMSGFPSSIYLVRINNQVMKFKK